MQKLSNRGNKIHYYEVCFFVCCICVCLFSAGDLFKLTWFAYGAFLAVCIATMLLKRRGKVYVNFEISLWLVFVIYSAVSVFWAKYNSLQSEQVFFLFLMYAFLFFSYEIYRENENAGLRLILIIVLTGTVLSVYTPVRYGVQAYIDAMLGGARMGAEVMGENSMGTFTCWAAIASFAMILFYKNKWCFIFMLLNVFACMSTGSRTSFISLVLGVLLIIFFYTYYKSFDKSKAIMKFMFFSIIVVVAIYLIIKYVPAFSTVYKRVEGLIRVLLGIESHTEGFGQSGIRNILVRVGIEEFFKHPLLGIGYNNSRDAAVLTTGTRYILHNNYAEVLCNGGLIGFILHYSVYGSLTFKHIKLLKTKSPVVAISFTLLIICLIQQFAGVMYVEKFFYFVLVLWFIVVNTYKVKLEQNSNVFRRDKR